MAMNSSAGSLLDRVPSPVEHEADSLRIARTNSHRDRVLEPLAYRKRNAATLIGISVRTLERLLAAGKFPRPDAHAGKCPLWTRESLSRWITEGGGRT
jgi:predicted DNA-binding transcriptional regulator AlpA